MDKIFITGGSGLLGSNISKLAVSKFHVYSTYNKNKVSVRGVHFFQIDLAKKDNLDKIKEICPDFIIHCAALANVDYCEEYPDEAYKQNVLVSGYIAETAKKIGSRLIHISTDHVFNGEKGDYKESDPPNPINIYGKTKLEAEQKVLSIYPGACVVRTNIFGWNKIARLSLAEWMIDKLTNNKELPGLKDIYFSPILVNNLANILFKLQETKYEGIIHITGSESCSKLDFAYKLAEVFNLDKFLIKSVSIRDIGLKTPRGKNTSLNVSKAEKILREHLPGIEEDLKKMKRLLKEGYVKELKHG